METRHEGYKSVDSIYKSDKETPTTKNIKGEGREQRTELVLRGESWHA